MENIINTFIAFNLNGFNHLFHSLSNNLFMVIMLVCTVICTIMYMRNEIDVMVRDEQNIL